MKESIKLTISEVNNIIAHHLIREGRLENKETTVTWKNTQFGMEHAVVELHQES